MKMPKNKLYWLLAIPLLPFAPIILPWLLIILAIRALLRVGEKNKFH